MAKVGKIALLGAGVMATPIGFNLLKKGYALTVWNRSLEKCNPLVEAGARLAKSPKEAVANAEIVFSILKDDIASQQVWSGPYGTSEAIDAGTTVIELSTITPDWSKRLSEVAKDRGARYIEAPMAGGPKAAADALLILLVAGEKDDIAEVDSAFAAISRERIHVGDIGSATTLKLVRNLFLAVQVVGIAEILALASKSDLNMDVVVASILKGPTASPVVAAIIEDMVADREGSDFTIDLLRKDVEYGLNQARQSNLALRVAEAARSALTNAQDAGLGERSITMLAQAIRSAKQS